jgi:hypothetical protein
MHLGPSAFLSTAFSSAGDVRPSLNITNIQHQHKTSLKIITLHISTSSGRTVDKFPNLLALFYSPVILTLIYICNWYSQTGYDLLSIYNSNK